MILLSKVEGQHCGDCCYGDSTEICPVDENDIFICDLENIRYKKQKVKFIKLSDIDEIIEIIEKKYGKKFLSEYLKLRENSDRVALDNILLREDEK